MCSTPSGDGSSTAQTRGQTPAIALFLAGKDERMGPSVSNLLPAGCSAELPLYSTKPMGVSDMGLFKLLALRSDQLLNFYLMPSHFHLKVIGELNNFFSIVKERLAKEDCREIDKIRCSLAALYLL